MKTLELREVLEVEKLLRDWVRFGGSWSWNEDGSVDVNGNIFINYERFRFSILPFKFRKVSGYFSVYNNGLTSFENFPEEIGKDFNCEQNYVKSLEYFPKRVGGNFHGRLNFWKFSAKDIRKICKVDGKVHAK